MSLVLGLQLCLHFGVEFLESRYLLSELLSLTSFPMNSGNGLPSPTIH
jgi:hypothetical protein